jgi:multiple sugar transport system permease protein
LHAFLASIAVAWLAPVLYAAYASFRAPSDTFYHGYFSLPHGLSLANYRAIWSYADVPLHFRNTMLVTLPATALILVLASGVAFAVARFSFRLNGPLLAFFTAASLLPPQAIVTPLYRLMVEIPLPSWLSGSGYLYDSYVGLILVHVAFQTGFCTFVLANYMRTIPQSLTDAARIDGAGALRQLFGVILPLCRPALAALATLEFTWIYNDFFWGLILIQTTDRRPLTTMLGGVFSNYYQVDGTVAAGAFILAAPMLVVYLLFQRQLIAGLTLGATRG